MLVLVYANSRERAMILATCIDGVMLRDKQTVRFKNFEQFHDKLEQEVIETGCIRAFFRGTPYVFVYTNGQPCTLKKMADYNPEYANLQNRPIPFIPENLEYKISDDEFITHFDFYEHMANEAAYIINAATDDMDGELSFMQFCKTLNVVEKDYYRVRPLWISETTVIEAFNTIENKSKREAISSACEAKERLDWLVSCNASNILIKDNYEHKPLVVGRIESSILTTIVERERLMEAQKKTQHFKITAKVKGLNHVLTTAAQDLTDSEAKTLLNSLKSGSKEVRVIRDHINRTWAPSPLLNAFTLQEKASEKGIMPKETDEAAKWLYHHGYINFPSGSSSLPWEAKRNYSMAVVALSQNPKYMDYFYPKDIEDYLEWETGAPRFGQIGLIVTDRVPDRNLTKTQQTIYDIIADADVKAIKSRCFFSSHVAEYECDKTKFMLVETKEERLPNGQFPDASETEDAAGTVYHVDSFSIEKAEEAERYTVSSLLKDLIDVFDNAFTFQSSFFWEPIENLIKWKAITIKDDQTIVPTTFGKLTYKYISDTCLSDIADIANWDKRLYLIASKKSNHTVFLKDIEAYIADICGDISDSCEQIRDMGGLSLRDCICPICGRQMELMDEGGAKCTGTRCKFAIPAKMFGHVITNFDIANILTKGSTDLIRDFSSEKGFYAARIVRNGEKLNRSFDSIYTCPYCNSAMSEYAWGIKCKNQDCGFKMNTTICQHMLSEQEIALILDKKKIKPVHMTNASGKSFVASLYLGDDKSIKFDFPQKKQ